MPDAPSPLLNLNLQGTGDNNNTWGVIANNDFVKLEDAITGDGGYAGGTGGIALSGTTYTLTSTFGVPDQASQLLWPFTGTLLADCAVTIPASVKIGWALNATTGGHSVILTTGVGGGTNLTIPAAPAASWTAFYCDGKNVTIFPMTLGAVSVTSLSVPPGGWSQGIQAPWFEATSLDASGGGGQFRAVGGGYGVFIRNDGSSTYLLLTNNGSPYGSFNSLRPFAISNATGAVSLDGTGAGTTVGGTLQIGSSGQFYLNPNSGGNRLLNFAANQYIQWVSGTGLQINSTGGTVAITGSAFTFNGNAVAAQGTNVTFGQVDAGNVQGTVGDIGGVTMTGGGVLGVPGALTVGGSVTVSGVITVGGTETLSGNSFFFTNTSGGLQQSAWSFGIGINCSSGANGVAAAGFFTNSDARLKTDIEEIGAEEATGWVRRGRPVRFKWKDGMKPSAGFIAQEEMAADRDGGSVIEAEDGTLIKDYNHEIPYLTKALQAAFTAIEAMAARIEMLEARLK